MRGILAEAAAKRQPVYRLETSGAAWFAEQIAANDATQLLDLCRDQRVRLFMYQGAPAARLPDGREALIKSRAFALWLDAEAAFVFDRIFHPDDVRKVIAILSERVSARRTG
jgi:hypothetical protein